MAATKRQLVTAPIHRKAGPWKNKRKFIGSSICPMCRGDLMVQDWSTGRPKGNWPCPRCRGTGVVDE